MAFKMTRPDEKTIAMIKASGDKDENKAYAAQYEIAKAVELPLRQGVLSGDILDGIFEPIQLESNATAEFPLDFLAPGTESEFVAYTIPNAGYIPQAHVEGDYVTVPIYDVGNAIDTNIKYARDGRWDIENRMMEVLRAGFVKKLNDDGFRVLISAAADRNIVVLDSDAAAGQFTKRLVSLLQLGMRRNGGGNSSSVNRRKLTDLCISPEANEDIRNWNVDQIDGVTRREIMVSAGENGLNRIFGVNLRVLDEFGEGQEYQLFYENELSGTLPGSDVELVLGLDLSRNDSFIMPVREELEVFPDAALHRQRRMGFYSWASLGFACLDGRNVMLASL